MKEDANLGGTDINLLNTVLTVGCKCLAPSFKELV
jgi:hypothetical protein